MPAHPARFAAKVPRHDKRRAGRTRVCETPLIIQTSGVELPDELRQRIRLILGRRLARFGTHIERASARFEDINGPRGGQDTLCRLKLTVSGRPPVLVEGKADTPEGALSGAASSIRRALGRSVRHLGSPTPQATRPPPARRHTRLPQEKQAAAPAEARPDPRALRSRRRTHFPATRTRQAQASSAGQKVPSSR